MAVTKLSPEAAPISIPLNFSRSFFKFLYPSWAVLDNSSIRSFISLDFSPSIPNGANPKWRIPSKRADNAAKAITYGLIIKDFSAIEISANAFLKCIAPMRRRVKFFICCASIAFIPAERAMRFAWAMVSFLVATK